MKLRLSPAAELGVRAALVLTEHYGKGPVTLSQIGEVSELSGEYLSKVLAMLSRANVVNSVRGKHGGYVLAADPSTINLLQVVEAIEGPTALNLCQFDPPRCENVKDCKVQKIWHELQETFNAKLKSMTLDRCI
jgi:Rrf2 family protein